MVEFNNSQRLGLDIDRHIALDAGAGTGKTTVMAERYVQHLLTSEQRATYVTGPGPRTPLSGHGSLQAPKRERTSTEDWAGLLPNETVAITFTRKSAAELKAKIRTRLTQTFAHPISADTEGVFDPRIKKSGDVEMLLSMIDEAPISTIDSFLSSIVKPYMDLVTMYPVSQQLAEETSPMMLQEALQSTWRIRSAEDAFEAGVLDYQEAFVASRNRLVARLGGQYYAEKVLKGLLSSSLFVEQSKRSMMVRAGALGIGWNGRDTPDARIVYDILIQPIAHDLGSFVAELYQRLSTWVNHFLEYDQHCIAPADVGDHRTRMNYLIRLIQAPLPTEPIHQLTFVWKAAMAMASTDVIAKPGPVEFLKDNKLTTAKGWPAGLCTPSKYVGFKKDEKDAVYEQGLVFGNSVRDHMNSEFGLLVRALSYPAFLLEPGDGYQGIPEDSKLYAEPLQSDTPTFVESSGYYVPGEVQTEMLEDLFTVHKGCSQILARRKSLLGAMDFDDLQRFASDLLLARCPDVCRFSYPPDVVDALDSLGEEAWRDEHVARAMTLLNNEPVLRDDLAKRIGIVQEIRRQYRAFIIDEYQDTNPAHYRLLSRLWGVRRREKDDPGRPLGPWEPTICIVGDMKQSIYRFRQAEVSVMKRTVEFIQQHNVMEVGEPRLAHLLNVNAGRDPRPVGAGGETGSFTTDHAVTESLPFTYVNFDWPDDPSHQPIEGNRLFKRQRGHIDLISNHRTRPSVMNTLNALFDDVFDPKYNILPGDWYADAQRLHPARVAPSSGRIEWLLPIPRIDPSNQPSLEDGIDVFSDEQATDYQREHELIAARLEAMFAQRTPRVWNSEQACYEEIEPYEQHYGPQDVMILVSSRRYVPDLVERLQRRNVPVLADSEGELLKQPVVQPLMSLLELMNHPSSRYAGITFARSPVVGFGEEKIHAIFSNHIDAPILDVLIEASEHPPITSLLEKIRELIHWGAVYDVLDYVIDHSDLLTAYPMDSHRQHVEAWYAYVHSIGKEFGHNISSMTHRLQELSALGDDGPSATTLPTGSAVQIMTIHRSKGLQAPIVIVTGLFRAGKSAASLAVSDNVLVTPQIVSGRIKPWLTQEEPKDGLWQFATTMNKAQDKAELRRKFYVALTRVRDHLIIVGGPSNATSTHVPETGEMTYKFDAESGTMGRMWMEGLWQISWDQGCNDAPWICHLPPHASSLPLFANPSAATPINPAHLQHSIQLGEGGVSGLYVFTHPECFGDGRAVAPYRQLIDTQALLSPPLPPPAVNGSKPPTSASFTMKGAAHHLDQTFECPRRYWLEAVNGLPFEAMVVSSQKEESSIHQEEWPKPTTFGLMMHRVLEIGLPNPRAFHQHSPPLSRQWHHESEADAWTNPTVIEQVLNEFGYVESSTSREVLNRLRQRMMHLSELLQKGTLGMWLTHPDSTQLCIEAVRTELPFLYQHPILKDFNQLGFEVPYDTIMMEFQGRADLVLAKTNEVGDGFLQVLDLKTTGCLGRFDERDASNGHPLQQRVAEVFETHPVTEAERALLHEHRLQLTLYSMVLKAMEATKPEAQRRTVLPPGIIVGASGRVLCLDEHEYETAQHDLINHLEWRALIHLDSTYQHEPKRLERKLGVCQTCPFALGDIKRCAPLGEPIGWIQRDDSA